MRGAFVDRISLVLGFARQNQSPFEFGHMIVHGLQITLHGQQNGMHLLEFVFKMTHGHLQADDAFRQVGYGQWFAFFREY
jgi:hypothetical protein